MWYVSTRGGAPRARLDDVILNGFAPDGGLYVPETIPTVDLATLASWKVGLADGLKYAEVELHREDSCVVSSLQHSRYPPNCSNMMKLTGETEGI
jgi:threonine synthase